MRTMLKLLAGLVLLGGITACAVYPQASYHDHDGYRTPYAHGHGHGWRPAWGYQAGYAAGRGWRGHPPRRAYY